MEETQEVKLDGTPKKTSAGRKPKLTKEIVDIIGEQVEKGMYADRVSHVIGVKYQTYANWLTKARKPNARGIYGYLGKVILDAEQKSETALIEAARKRALEPYEEVVTEVTKLPDGTNIQKIRKKTIQPDMSTIKWLLSRRFPKRWGEKLEHDIKQHISTESDREVLVTVMPEPDEELKKILDSSTLDHNASDDYSSPSTP